MTRKCIELESEPCEKGKDCNHEGCQQCLCYGCHKAICTEINEVEEI